MSGFLHPPIPPAHLDRDGLLDRAGARVLVAICHLIQAVADHRPGESRTVETIRKSQGRLVELARALGRPYTLSWADDGSCWISDRLLRGERQYWTSARRLGERLRQIGIAGLTFDADLREQALVDFAQRFLQDQEIDGRSLLAIEQRGLTVHAAAEPPQAGGHPLRHVFARLVAEVDQYHQALAAQTPGRSPELARLAFMLAGLCRSSLTAPGHLAAVALGAIDPRPSVQAAQIGILMATLGSRLTDDRDQIARLAHMGLISLGAQRLTPEGSQVESRAVEIMLAAGGLTHEGVLWARSVRAVHQPEQDPAFVPGRLLALCRAYVERLYHGPDVERMPASVLRGLSRRADVSPDLLRLLIQTVGVIPVGSPVLMEDGAVGVVVALSQAPDALASPQIRLLITPTGDRVTRPLLLDLGQAKATGEGRHRIARPLSPGECPLTALHTLV